MPLRTLRAAAVILALTLVGILPATARAQTADLLITEYVEGSGNNKALEIFNGTEDVVNLDGYVVACYANGATIPTSTVALPAVDLAPGEAWVVTNNLADAALLAFADQTDAQLNFNGNDALVLSADGGRIVDSFGQVGFDPGQYWSCADGTTQNHTLRRLSSICSGDEIPGDAFDPCDEYNFYSVDLFSGLGFHTADCGAVPADPVSWGSLKAGYR